MYLPEIKIAGHNLRPRAHGYVLEVGPLGRLTNTDIDIAIFEKPKPTPTRYLENPKTTD